MDAILTLLSALAAVVAILALSYWFTKNVVGRSNLGAFSARQGTNLQVIETLSLGREHRIVAIRAGERYFLLGVTESEVSTITELTAEEIENWKREPQNESTSFKQAFLASFERKR